MLELYEQNKMPQGSEIEGSSGVAHNQRGPSKTSAINEELIPNNGHTPAGAGSVSSSAKPGTSKQTLSLSGADNADNHNAQSNLDPKPEKDNGSTEISSVITEQKIDGEMKDDRHDDISQKDVVIDASNESKAEVDKIADDVRAHNDIKNEAAEAGELKEPIFFPTPIGGRIKNSSEGPDNQSPQLSRTKFDVDKLKAVVEKKKKKSRLDIPRKKDVVDEDDLIERALEDGVELAIEDERMKQKRRQSWPKDDTDHHTKDHEFHNINKGQSSKGTRSTEFVEEGEMLDDSSPIFNSRKRKASPLDKVPDTKHHHDYGSGQQRNHHGNTNTRDDGHRSGRGGGYSEREYRKHT